MVPMLKRRCRKEGTIESYRWMLFQKESAGYDKTDKHIGKKIRRLKGDKKVRSKRYKKTYEFKDEKYSPELIRKYEDPEYAKAAENTRGRLAENKPAEAKNDMPPVKLQHLRVRGNVVRAVQKEEISPQ